MKFIFLTFSLFYLQLTYATEEMYVADLNCESGKLLIELRSLKQDYHLYLANDLQGEPVYFESYGYCNQILKNLREKILFKTLMLDCNEKKWSKIETFSEGGNCPNDRCPQRTFQREVYYERIDCRLDQYRFFNIYKD